MTKIVLRKTTSAIFLAIVLVLGTITLSIPTFMTNVQATSDREKDYDNDEDKKSYLKDRDDESRDNDKDYDEDEDKSYGKESRDYKENYYDNDEDKKSYYKERSYDSKYSSYKDNYKSEYSSYGKDKSEDSSSVNIKKIKCNNINLNLNGIGVNIGVPNNNGPVTGPIAEAQTLDDDNEETESFVSNGEGRQSDSNTNSRILCINNNNNVVVGQEGEEEPEPIPEEECEECFNANSTLQAALEEFLVDEIGDFDFAVDSEVLHIPGEVNTIEELCPLLEGHTDFLINFAFNAMINGGEPGPAIGFEASIDALVECLLEAGVIVEATPPP